MDKLDLVEAVNRSGLIEVFTQPYFDPNTISGCDEYDRSTLRTVRKEIKEAMQDWGYFLADAYEYHAEADCD